MGSLLFGDIGWQTDMGMFDWVDTTDGGFQCGRCGNPLEGKLALQSKDKACQGDVVPHTDPELRRIYTICRNCQGWNEFHRAGTEDATWVRAIAKNFV